MNELTQGRLSMDASVQYCTFYLAGLVFGVEVRQVQEVIRYQEMTAVPLAPPVIQGLINLRGQIVTAIDLRKRLELPPRKEGQLPMNVVVNCSGGTVSLLVDEIGDVMETEEKNFAPVPETLSGVSRELVTRVYKLQKGLLLLLDVERAVDVGGKIPN